MSTPDYTPLPAPRSKGPSHPSVLKVVASSSTKQLPLTPKRPKLFRRKIGKFVAALIEGYFSRTSAWCRRLPASEVEEADPSRSALPPRRFYPALRVCVSYICSAKTLSRYSGVGASCSPPPLATMPILRFPVLSFDLVRHPKPARVCGRLIARRSGWCRFTCSSGSGEDGVCVACLRRTASAAGAPRRHVMLNTYHQSFYPREL